MSNNNDSFSLEVDSKTFTKRAKKFLDDLGKKEKDFIREQTSFLARDLAKFTPPYVTFPTGNKNTVGTAKDIAQGKKAVELALRSICKARKKKTINWARKAFGNGPIIINGKQIGHGVIDDMNALHTWHKKNRNMFGRTKRVAENERPFVFKTLLNKYIKLQKQNVGIAKASFYKASLHLGGKHNAVRAIKMGLAKGTGKGKVNKDSKGYEGSVYGLAKGAYRTKNHLPNLRKDRQIKAIARLKILASKQAKEAELNEYGFYD